MRYIIIGLGNYGRVLIEELSALGHEVIGVDNDMNKIDRVKDKCTASFQIDAADEVSLNILPLTTVDVVVVAIGVNLGASIRITALLKQKGVAHIYARAIDALHKSILQAFSVDKILLPEEEAARSLVHQMDLGVKVDVFRIDHEYGVYRFSIPKAFEGHSPNKLQLYEEFNLRIISVLRNGKATNCLGIEYDVAGTMNVVEETMELSENDVLVVYGKEADFRKLLKAI